MKNDYEMYQGLLSRYDEYKSKMAKKNKIALRLAVAASSVLIMVGIVVWKYDLTNENEKIHLSSGVLSGVDNRVIQPSTFNYDKQINPVFSLDYCDTTYFINDAVNTSEFTKDNCIGKVCDYNVYSVWATYYDINLDDCVYSVKESKNILLVLKNDGTSVAMVASNLPND